MHPFIVRIGGTTRDGSSSERLTAAVLVATERLGARSTLFGGAKRAELPHFAPESQARTAAQRELVEAVRAADGLVIGTPGYHGGISGLVKNAIGLQHRRANRFRRARRDRRCRYRAGDQGPGRPGDVSGAPPC